jgi:small subunit ribosomal protein S25e
MGGAKKTAPKLSKALKEAEEKKKEAEKKKEITKSTTTSVVDPKVLDQIKKEVPKMKFVTPYQLYSKYNLKYSVSKDILESMAKQGTLKLMKSGRRVDIYVPAA